MLTFTLAGLRAFAQDCDERPHEILARSSAGYTAVWTFTDSPALHAPLKSNDRNYQRYVRWVRANTPMDARELLRNHLAVGQKIARNLQPGDGMAEEIRRGEAAAKRILGGSVGRIQKIRCLEGLAFIEFLRVADLRRQALEFNATILKKDGTITMIGDFFVTENYGSPGTAESRAAAKHRRKLQRQGYTLLAHLHNHPFNFGNPYGDIGGVVMPSPPDVMLYSRLKPVQARVTNGLETFAAGPSALSH